MWRPEKWRKLFISIDFCLGSTYRGTGISVWCHSGR